MFADHLSFGAELFGPLMAKPTVSTRGEVMDANTILQSEILDAGAALLDGSGYLMTESQRQGVDE
jgi:hypothetical protein